jgi:signal transduction histidine kinase
MALPKWPRRVAWPGGLSARLLLLTALFVMAAELLMLAPSLAAFQDAWLTSRVRAAELASLAVEAAPAGVVSDKMAGELLEGAGVVSVAVQSGGVRRLLLQAPRMARFPQLVDLRRFDPLAWLSAPFEVIAPGGPPMLRVVARPQFRSGDFVEIVVPEAPLRRDLLNYMGRVVAVSALISVVAGLIVYLALNAFLVRPMLRITQSMERFRAAPEDPAARMKPSGRRDEIGRAEQELGLMQDELRTALQSRSRLAALGEAVAKINHDLRNMLTSAQVVAERLQGSGDPRVTSALPRLERALDRAVKLAQNVMAYGKSETPSPDPSRVPLAAAAEAAAEDAGLFPAGVALVAELPAELTVRADPEQLDRILVNIFKNAREAIEAAGRTTGKVTLTAETPPDGGAAIRIADDGPGVPERLRERLFQPFAGSSRPDGAGLGLAIARELARAHGGELSLTASGAEGSVFELRLPGAGA